MLQIVRVESTPNPCARKWVLSERAWYGSKSFLTVEDASDDALGSKLMAIAGVRTVLLCGDWFTVNVESASMWRRVKKSVDEIAEEWLTNRSEAV